jgi:hypothetical protein
MNLASIVKLLSAKLLPGMLIVSVGSSNSACCAGAAWQIMSSVQLTSVLRMQLCFMVIDPQQWDSGLRDGVAMCVGRTAIVCQSPP